MDPIRTAVRYSLIPLRTVVEIGEAFVQSGEEIPQPEPQATSQPRTAAKRRQPARKRTSPQASRTPKDLSDVGLARKVETVIFRDSSIPKGKIDVNAADGVVWIRGEANNPEMIKAIQRQAATIPEVKKVENLLHLPNTPAPTRADAPGRQRRTAGTTRRPAERKVESRVTNEGRTAQGEDLPVEAAHEREGRQPAPLGSNGAGS